MKLWGDLHHEKTSRKASTCLRAEGVSSARDPGHRLVGLQPETQRGRGRGDRAPSPPARASLSSRPLILAPANCAYPTTRVNSAGIWILQHRYKGAPRPSPHPPPSGDPYKLPDSYWHRPPRTGSPYNTPQRQQSGRAVRYDLSASPPPERMAHAVFAVLAAFNSDRMYEAEQVNIKRPAPAGRDSSASGVEVTTCAPSTSALNCSSTRSIGPKID